MEELRQKNFGRILLYWVFVRGRNMGYEVGAILTGIISDHISNEVAVVMMGGLLYLEVRKNSKRITRKATPADMPFIDIMALSGH